MKAMSAESHQEGRLSFAEIVTLHQEAVYRFLLRFTRNISDAQDLFQDTFLRAHRAYAALPKDANVRAWLMRIAINLTKNYVRDRQRRRRVIVDSEVEFSPQGKQEILAPSDTEGIMISREITQTLLTAIDTLPFRQRVALVQRQFEGLEYPKIAANLGCSPESARAHVYQALRKLRVALDHATPNEQEGEHYAQ
jgi:RNA polymerase sigma-70 factor (ECF subfamily)